MADDNTTSVTFSLNLTAVHLQVGDSTKLEITASDGGTYDVIEWTSSNSEVVSVDKDGKITALDKTNADTVIVTATVKIDNDKTSTVECTVTVSEQTKKIYTKEFFKGIPSDKRTLIYQAAAQLAAGYLGFDSTVIMGTGGGLPLLLGRLASLQISYPWILTIAAQMYEYVGGYDIDKVTAQAKSVYGGEPDEFSESEQVDLDLYNKTESSTDNAQNK